MINSELIVHYNHCKCIVILNSNVSFKFKSFDQMNKLMTSLNIMKADSVHGIEGKGSRVESGTAAAAAAAAAGSTASEHEQQPGGCLAPVLPAALLSAIDRSSATFSARPRSDWLGSRPNSCLISAAAALISGGTGAGDPLTSSISHLMRRLLYPLQT